MKSLILIAFTMICAITTFAQSPEPTLEHVMTLNVKIEGAFNVGETAHGNRFVIPITGGTFEGPNIKGEVLNGGADYQLQNQELGRTEIEAIYCIRTDDGVNIHVRNCGLITNQNGASYFFTSPKFEAPADSKYAWLNNSIFVCRPDGGSMNSIILKVWKVK